MMAVTQIGNRRGKGRAYYERKRLEGKTPKEALRLKRRLSDVIYRQLLANQAGTIKECGSPKPACRRLPCQPAPPVRPGHDRASHDAFIALDWHNGPLVGIEVLDASTILPSDLLGQAEIVS
jgi:hypothetical protein